MSLNGFSVIVGCDCEVDRKDVLEICRSFGEVMKIDAIECPKSWCLKEGSVVYKVSFFYKKDAYEAAINIHGMELGRGILMTLVP